jgi:hypothetical protein
MQASKAPMVNGKPSKLEKSNINLKWQQSARRPQSKLLEQSWNIKQDSHREHDIQQQLINYNGRWQFIQSWYKHKQQLE